jgi:hypothetical protein
MRQLELLDDQFGVPDYDRGGVRRVFLADEAIGGSRSSSRRAHPFSVVQKAAFGPLGSPETGYMTPAGTSWR